MKKETKSCPSRHVPLEVSDALIDSEWEGIRGGLQKRNRLVGYRFVGALGFVAIATLLVIGIFTFGETSPETPVGSGIEPTTSQRALTLPDGSHLLLDQRASMKVISASQTDVNVALSEGRVWFDVPPSRTRRFAVEAKGALILVRGTRFSVEVKKRDRGFWVEVLVFEGSVEIRDVENSETIVLNSGRNWSGTFSRDDGPAQQLGEELATVNDPGCDKVSRLDELPHDQKVNRQGKISELDTTKASNQNRASTAEKSIEAQTRNPSSEELFSQGQRYNLLGNFKLAANLFEKLIAQYSSDSRAPLAAFQLGRIRMDALGDPQGALEAFSAAARLGPGYPFIEDMEARRVKAFELLGQIKKCIAARQKYLANYPDGVHVASVKNRCAD